MTPAYNNISKNCKLCQERKVAIIHFLDKLLNKIAELISRCRHKTKDLLRSVKTEK